jgi:hypothetical protein
MEIKRICNKCNLEKQLDGEFRFNNNSGYYTKSCIECLNNERRLKRQPFLIDTTNLKENRRKCCIRCSIEKPLTNQYFRKSDHRFSKVCIECIGAAKIKKRQETNNLLAETDTITKRKCTKCKEDKLLKEFSYTVTTGFFSGACKSCVNARGKVRRDGKTKEEKKLKNESTKTWYNGVGKFKKFVTSYTNCDLYKGLENDLDEEYVKDSLSKSCSYCGFPSEGLDRIDNKIGHTKSNCIPACKSCNIARNNIFTFEEMQEIGKTLRDVKLKRLGTSLLESVDKLWIK